MGGAIETGGVLNMLMRNSSNVPISDMTGIMEFAGIMKERGQVYAAPATMHFAGIRPHMRPTLFWSKPRRATIQCSTASAVFRIFPAFRICMLLPHSTMPATH
jgi:hypothetical protein